MVEDLIGRDLVAAMLRGGSRWGMGTLLREPRESGDDKEEWGRRK